MASGSLFILLVLFISHVSSEQEDEIRLSEASVLLPYNSRVKYQIQALNGCFTWAVQRPSLLQFETEEECGNKVVFRSHSDTAGPRQSTFLVATDRHSRKVLRCEVFFDNVDRFEILTTTRTLYKDEIQRIYIQGYDAVGNTFSSLEGLDVNWEIQHEPQASLLKFVPFSASNVEPSSVLLSMDNEGKRSSAVLVRGVGVGKVNVSASIKEKVSERELKEAHVTLSILEPLELDPPDDVYLTVGSSLQFLLKTRMQDGLVVIPMPNPKYKWKSFAPDVATIDDSGEVSTHKLGRTSIEAQFIELSDNKAITHVFVVEPAYLDLKISLPIEDGTWGGMEASTPPWYLLEDQAYKIHLRVFDKDDHEITVTKNLVPDVSFDDNAFVLTGKSVLNWNFTTLSEQETTIEAKLGTLRLSQRVIIVPPVKIDTRRLLFPQHLLLPQNHEYVLEASGGSGAPYLWSTRIEPPIVQIEESLGNYSLVRSSNLIGTSTIKCKDNKCPINQQEISVTITHPRTVKFLGGPKEVLVGKRQQLFVALGDEHQHSFDNCSTVPIAVNIADSNIFKIVSVEACSRSRKTPCPPGACQIYNVEALDEGETFATADYTGYTAQVPLIAYHELRVSHPVVLVSLGASFTVGVQGGPKSWKSYPGHHQVTVTASTNSNTVAIQPLRLAAPESSWKLFTLTCKALGTQNITVRVQNNAPGTEGAEQTTHFAFRCKEPTRLYIYPDVEVDPNVPDDCVDSMQRFQPPAILQTADHFRVRSDRTSIFKVEAYDEELSFHNFSTISVKWLSNEKIASYNGPKRDLSHEPGFPNTFESLHNVTFHKAEGTVRFDVSFPEYISEKLSAAGVPYARLQTIVKQSFGFKLYNPIEVTPKSQVIFLHKDNLFKLDVLHGSAHFRTDINGTSHVKLERQHPSALEIRPLMEGHVYITITDMCYREDSATSEILVSKVHRLRINVRDMVQVGDTTPLEVIAEDKRGEAFPSSQYKLLTFESQLDHKDILSIRQQDSGSRFMTVHATSLGSCSITVSTKKDADGYSVASNPTLVHVFPPLQLVPDRLALMPGALIQLQWRGGPPARTELHFEIESGGQRKSIAEIHPKTGVLQAKSLGETAILATVFTYEDGQNRKSGNTTASAVVKVLKGIRIVSATSTLLVGEEMVLEVGGNEGETPFSWFKLDIEFVWEVGSRVVQLHPLNSGSESTFGVRVFAKAPGRTAVTVKIAKCSPFPQLVGMSASITLNTIEPLRLLSSPNVLVAPNSHYKIQTNYDHDPVMRSSLFYDILHTEEAWESYRTTDRPRLEVSPNGLITTSNSVGSMHIRVSERSGSNPSGQSVVLKLTVKPVYHVSLSPQTQSPFGIPVGKSQTLDIVVRDEMGAQFDSYDGISFDYLLNVLDVVAVSLVQQGNYTLSDTKGYAVKTSHIPSEPAAAPPSSDTPFYFGHSSLQIDGLSPGNAILRLYVRGSDNTKMIHFPIRVMNSIEPSNVVLHVGGQVQFSTSFFQEGSSCKTTAWSSSDNTTLEISSLGFAKALKPGGVQVYYNCTVHTHTTVRIVPVSHIASGEQHLSFVNDQLIVRVPIDFQGKEDSSVASLVEVPNVKQNINYRCGLKSHQLVTASERSPQPTIKVAPETINGIHACVVYMKTSALFGQGSSLNTIGDLLRLPALQVEVAAETEAISIPLALSKTTPIFELEGASKEPLSLSDGPKSVTVMWHLPEGKSAPQLEVSTNENQLEVQEGNGDETIQSYLIRLGKPSGVDGHYTPFLNARVTFTYPATGQQVVVFVSYGYGPHATDLAEIPTARDSSSNFYSLAATLLIMGCMTAFYRINRFQTPATAPATLQGQAPYTPGPQQQQPYNQPQSPFAFQTAPTMGATPYGGIPLTSPMPQQPVFMSPARMRSRTPAATTPGYH